MSQPVVSAPCTHHIMSEFTLAMNNKMDNEAIQRPDCKYRLRSETAKVQITSQILLGQTWDSHLLSVHLFSL